jgi:hypothetical protein
VKRRLSKVAMFLKPIVQESIIYVFIYFKISLIDQFPAFSFSIKRLFETASVPYKSRYSYPNTKKDCGKMLGDL